MNRSMLLFLWNPAPWRAVCTQTTRTPSVVRIQMEPGDITVLQISDGYVLGRVIRPLGPGFWWVYLTTVHTRDEAVREMLARVEGGYHAWFQFGGDFVRFDTDRLPVADIDDNEFLSVGLDAVDHSTGKVLFQSF